MDFRLHQQWRGRQGNLRTLGIIDSIAHCARELHAGDKLVKHAPAALAPRAAGESFTVQKGLSTNCCLDWCLNLELWRLGLLFYAGKLASLCRLRIASSQMKCAITTDGTSNTPNARETLVLFADRPVT